MPRGTGRRRDRELWGTDASMCIWEGESVEAVREVVEGAVGAWSDNEYFEMHVDGLTPQLQT